MHKCVETIRRTLPRLGHPRGQNIFELTKVGPKDVRDAATLVRGRERRRPLRLLSPGEDLAHEHCPMLTVRMPRLVHDDDPQPSVLTRRAEVLCQQVAALVRLDHDGVATLGQVGVQHDLRPRRRLMFAGEVCADPQPPVVAKGRETDTGAVRPGPGRHGRVDADRLARVSHWGGRPVIVDEYLADQAALVLVEHLAKKLFTALRRPAVVGLHRIEGHSVDVRIFVDGPAHHEVLRRVLLCACQKSLKYRMTLLWRRIPQHPRSTDACREHEV